MFFRASSQGTGDPARPKRKARKKTKGSHVRCIALTGTLVSVDSKAGTLRLKARGKELGITAVTKAAKEALGKLNAVTG